MKVWPQSAGKESEGTSKAGSQLHGACYYALITKSCQNGLKGKRLILNSAQQQQRFHFAAQLTVGTDHSGQCDVKATAQGKFSVGDNACVLSWWKTETCPLWPRWGQYYSTAAAATRPWSLLALCLHTLSTPIPQMHNDKVPSRPLLPPGGRSCTLHALQAIGLVLMPRPDECFVPNDPSTVSRAMARYRH